MTALCATLFLKLCPRSRTLQRLSAGGSAPAPRVRFLLTRKESGRKETRPRITRLPPRLATESLPKSQHGTSLYWLRPRASCARPTGSPAIRWQGAGASYGGGTATANTTLLLSRVSLRSTRPTRSASICPNATCFNWINALTFLTPDAAHDRRPDSGRRPLSGRPCRCAG
jgi:hypothetical protein